MSSEIDYGLNAEQKIFIEQKVQQLGSISAVNKLYLNDCPVDKYARHIAQETYPRINSSIKLNERLTAVNEKSLPHTTLKQKKVVSRPDNHILATASTGKQLQNIKMLQDEINNKRIDTKIKNDTTVANRKIFEKKLSLTERKKENNEVKNNIPNTKKKVFEKRYTPLERKKTKVEIKNNIDVEEDSVIIRYDDPVISVENRENAEALVRMAERKEMFGKSYHGTSIPEYEEGAPRSEFGTRNDHKRMQQREYGDMRKRHRE